MSAPLPSTSIPSAGSFNVAAVADPTRAVVFPTCLVEQLRPSLAGDCVAWSRIADGANRSWPRARRAVANLRGTPASRRPLAGWRAARCAPCGGGDGPVVVPSGSCATMMGHHWPELFAGTKDEAAPRERGGARRRALDLPRPAGCRTCR